MILRNHNAKIETSPPTNLQRCFLEVEILDIRLFLNDNSIIKKSIENLPYHKVQGLSRTR